MPDNYRSVSLEEQAWWDNLAPGSAFYEITVYHPATVKDWFDQHVTPAAPWARDGVVTVTLANASLVQYVNMPVIIREWRKPDA